MMERIMFMRGSVAIAAVILMSGINAEVPSAGLCGPGTVLDGGVCTIDKGIVDPRIRTRQGAIDLEINGARLTLQPTTPGFKKTDGNGRALCSGSHVEVNAEGVCSPKIEVLGVGDKQIRLAEIITAKDLDQTKVALTASLADQEAAGEVARAALTTEVEAAVADAKEAIEKSKADTAATIAAAAAAREKVLAAVTDTVTAIEAAGTKTAKDLVTTEEALTKKITALAEAAQKFYNHAEHGLLPWVDACADAQKLGYRNDGAIFFLTANEKEKLKARAIRCTNMGKDDDGNDLEPKEEKLGYRSCMDVKAKGLNSGAYKIRPNADIGEITVFCDMDTAGGGWTYCYNHNVRNTEEMDHSNLNRFTNNGGAAAKDTDHWRNCAGLHKAMNPKQTRITSGNAWIQINEVPAKFSDFFRCGESVAVQVESSSGFKGKKTANLHDCGAKDWKPKNMLNQIGTSTNNGICFEMNGKSADSNHHWYDATPPSSR